MKSIPIESDDILRFYAVASFRGNVFAAQVVFAEDEKTIKNFETQANGLVSATRRSLLKKEILDH